MEFGEDFDVDVYRKFLGKNSILSRKSTKFLYNHYCNYGIYEGHIVHTNKRSYYYNIEQSLEVLEIHPYHSPIANHLDSNVYSVDICSQEQLIETAMKDPTINNNAIKHIPKTTFLLSEKNNFSITKCITDKKFDVILSSHNVDRCPNLIKYLNDYSSILNDNGCLVAFIPDCRFEFNSLRKETSLSDILSDFYNENTKPTFKQIIDCNILRCSNDAVVHWKNHYKVLYNRNIESLKKIDGHVNDKYNTTTMSKQDIDKLYLLSKTTYVDTHNYTFNSKSFKQFIKTLYNLKYINFNVHKMYHTLKDSNEFCVILKKCR